MAKQETSKHMIFGLDQIMNSQVVDVLKLLEGLEVWSADGSLPDMALVRVTGGDLLENNLHRLLVSPSCPFVMAVIAAWKGCPNLLKWAYALRPLEDSAAAMCKVIAAGHGHQELLCLLLSLYPMSNADFSPCIAAAHEGCLQALKLLASTDPACDLNESVSIMACNKGHLEMVEWLLTQAAVDIAPIAQWACTAGSLAVLRMLKQHGLLHKTQYQDICLVASRGDVQALKLLEQHIRTSREEVKYCLALDIIKGSGPLSGLTNYHEESCNGEYPKTPRDAIFIADHPGALQRLLQHAGLQPCAAMLSRWQEIADESGTIVLAQLAARCPDIRITWSALTHRRAAAWGNIALLKWLVAEPAAASFRVVHKRCSDGRIMLLVHGYGWTLPVDMKPRLTAAERRCFALASAVKQLRETALHRTHLGHLPDAIIKKIGCMANVDFSWSFSA